MRFNNILILFALALTLLLGTAITMRSSSQKIKENTCSALNNGCEDDTDCCKGLRCQMVPQRFFGKCVE